MKNKLTTLLFFLTLILYGQDSIVTINNYQFTFKKISKFNDSGDPIIKIAVFRNKTKVLTHIIYKSVGDCNSVSIELGSYETSDSSITFYSYFNRAGDAPASPYGVRKQIYIVDSTGKISLSQSAINIETAGFSPPYNNFEKYELKVYVKEIEKNCNAKFVYGEAKKMLFIEVKTKLNDLIQKATKDWKKIYGNKFSGYKL